MVLISKKGWLNILCDWCINLESSIEDILEKDYTGVSIGKNINFYPWDKKEENKIIIQLWYDKECGMDQRDFLIELMMKDVDGSGVHLVAPIKFCPNCGRNLKIPSN